MIGHQACIQDSDWLGSCWWPWRGPEVHSAPLETRWRMMLEMEMICRMMENCCCLYSPVWETLSHIWSGSLVCTAEMAAGLLEAPLAPA